MERSEDDIELSAITFCDYEDIATIDRPKFTEKSFSEFKDVSEALQFFDFSSIKEELEKLDETLVLKIQVDGPFENLRQSELQKLSRKCRNKSIVVLFSSKNQNKFSIYWKSKELQHFLTLSPYKDFPVVTDKNFYDFLAIFLAESLANGHLGVLSSVLKFAEKGKFVELHLIADQRDFNLLLIAVELGKNDIVKVLLEQNIETDLYTNEQEIMSQDLAWEAHHYDVVLTLMKAGVTYPKSFKIDQCSSELREFCEKSEELHEAIITSNETKIKQILDNNTDSHPFYNRLNESAAKIALSWKLIDIYKLLTTCKVFLGRNEIFHDFWKNFSVLERDMLRKIHFQNSVHMPKKHINDLINCSSVSHDDKNAQINLNIAQYAFGILNQIAFIRIILMIVSASRKLKNIIFDFKSKSVDVVDPTADSNTRGLFYMKGIVCIAAGFLLDQSTEHETFGTLAHELCHYAMSLVYKNRARPYERKDRERQKEFAKVVKICEQNRKKEEIIDMAFHYPPQMQHAELIVRVPHLLALYHNQPEELTKAQENFGPLFDYYEQKVVPDMESALPRIEKEIEQMDKQILKNKIISITTLVLSIIVIIAGFFVTRSILYKPVYDFSGLSKIEKTKVENATVNYKNVHVQFQDLFPKNSSVYQNITSDHISQILDGQALNFSDPHLYYLDELVRHDWENLTGNLRKKFLSSDFVFQNESLKLENLYGKIKGAFKFLTSEQIIYVLDGNEMIIDKMISNRTTFYVERNFWSDKVFEIYFAYKKSVTEKNMSQIEPKKGFPDFYDDFLSLNSSIFMQKIDKIKQDAIFTYYFGSDFDFYFTPVFNFKTLPENFDKILNRTKQAKLFILSSEAGTGKTTTFEQFTIKIKKKFPTRWVTYIDFKDYTTFYNRTEYFGNPLALFKEIFDLNSKSQFERKIFRKLFESGEVVLLWNGFDEISPNYSDFILTVLDSIFRNTNNTQLVCTRPLYKDLLEKKFQISSFNLVPFDNENQEEFLRKIFTSANIQEEKFKKYIDKVHKIVNALSIKIWSGESREGFNTPLMLEMIADLISNEVEIYETENFWEIYEKFVRRKIKIWGKRSDFATQYGESAVIDYRKFDMMEFYQMHAIRSEIPNLITILGSRDKRFLVERLKIMRQKIPPKLTNAEISRMGILYINNENGTKFAHKTFAEFFVAQFFIESIYNAEDIADFQDAELIFQLFVDVTEFYASRQLIITDFMKSFLQMQNVNKNVGFNAKIAEICRTKYGNFLFDLLKQKKSEIFEFWFEFFNKDHKLLVDLLHVNESETLYTAAFNFAYRGDDLNRTALKELGRKYLTDDEYEKFIHGRNQKGIIQFSLYLFYRLDVENDRNRNVFHDEYDLGDETFENVNKSSVFEQIVRNLTKSEIRELILSTSSPISWTELELTKQDIFWYIAESSLTKREKKILLSNIFRKFSIYSNSWDSIPFFINKSEEISSDSDIFEIFQQRNLLQWSAVTPPLHEDSKTFEELWNFLTKHTSKQEQRSILLHEVHGECFDYEDITPNQKCHDYTPFNIFHILLAFSRNEVNYTTVFYQKYFNKTEMKQIILKSNDFLYFFIKKNYAEYISDFADFLKDLFKGDEKSLEDYLSQKIKPTNLTIFEFIEGNDDDKKSLYDLSKKIVN